MKPARVVQLVVGVLMLIVGVPLLAAGAALGWLRIVVQDDDGWFRSGPEAVASASVAITSPTIDFGSRPDEDDWVPLGGDLATVRLTAGGEQYFVGIGPADDVAAYLWGVAHDEITDGLFTPGPVERTTSPGADRVAPPDGQDFWVASGRSTVTWDVEPGEWTAVLMRADGTAGIDADVLAAVRVSWLGPLAAGLAIGGAALAAVAVWMIVAAATAGGRAPATVAPHAGGRYALRLDARLDQPLSRWQWLVKWFLAIPHVLVLLALWVGLVVTTTIAFFAILITGRYPRRLFDYAVGVLRWSWRVGFYAFSAVGTDRYPPFRLDPDPTYPTDLDVVRPERLSRGLVLVKSWLLAIPHLILIAALGGGLGGQAGGAISALVLVAGAVLLVSGTYPMALFDVIIGCNRWTYRVLAYVLLLTDEYPPFRFDPGGPEPPAPAAPASPWPPPGDVAEQPPADRRELLDVPR